MDLGEGASLAVFDLTGIPPVILPQHPVWEAFAFSDPLAPELSLNQGTSPERACQPLSKAYALATPLCQRIPDLFPHAAFSVAGQFNLTHLPDSLARDLFERIQDTAIDKAPPLDGLQAALRNRLGARFQSDLFLASNQPVEPLLIILRDDGQHRFKARVHVILDGVDGEAFTVLRRSGF